MESRYQEPKLKRPRGNNPRGKRWNYDTGKWESKVTASGSAVVEAEGAAEEAQAAPVVGATSSTMPQPEKKQERACELVLTPLGDDAREEVGTE